MIIDIHIREIIRVHDFIIIGISLENSVFKSFIKNG